MENLYKQYRPYISKKTLKFSETIMNYYEKVDDEKKDTKLVIFEESNNIKLGFLYLSLKTICEENNYCLRQFYIDNSNKKIILLSQTLVNNISIGMKNKINYNKNFFPEYKNISICKITDILAIGNNMINKIDEIIKKYCEKYKIKEFCRNNKYLFIEISTYESLPFEIVSKLNSIIDTNIWEDGIKYKIDINLK